MFGLFKKKAVTQKSAPFPPADLEPNRYVGRPLLIVLENYVLDCIGELAPDKQASVRSIVQQTWGGGDDWKATVRAQLDMQPGMDDALRGMWSRNQVLANQQHQRLHPIQFAKMVADKNFASLIEATR